MTAQELMKTINEYISVAGIENPLPDHLDVDAVTYANICQYVFDNHQEATITSKFVKHIEIAIGMNNGIMFKGIELILKETK